MWDHPLQTSEGHYHFGPPILVSTCQQDVFLRSPSKGRINPLLIHTNHLTICGGGGIPSTWSPPNTFSRHPYLCRRSSPTPYTRDETPRQTHNYTYQHSYRTNLVLTHNTTVVGNPPRSSSSFLFCLFFAYHHQVKAVPPHTTLHSRERLTRRVCPNIPTLSSITQTGQHQLLHYQVGVPHIRALQGDNYIALPSPHRTPMLRSSL